MSAPSTAERARELTRTLEALETQRRALARERLGLIAKMRAGGASYGEIGAALGVGRHTARDLVRQATSERHAAAFE